ncbi:aspartate aminotransferase, putative [Babesia ovata]|uniref:Aspartate aminotransferase, putative n=1 Tax=Babesia ovata TaxID=189622 RepID=A0A2H6KH30_9APIC|nr:aspartate aminotransferase, putative [Babesia ovata]GBE62310.1 aspartate aminotransferase, putative [Babesia ovata]
MAKRVADLHVQRLLRWAVPQQRPLHQFVFDLLDSVAFTYRLELGKEAFHESTLVTAFGLRHIAEIEVHARFEEQASHELAYGNHGALRAAASRVQLPKQP